jgi:hypothetical protein
MRVYPPLYAVQRLASGQWLVRVPVDDPLLPAVLIVDVIDETRNFFHENDGGNVRTDRIKPRQQTRRTVARDLSKS